MNYFTRFKAMHLLKPFIFVLTFIAFLSSQAWANTTNSNLRFSVITTAESSGSVEAMVVDGGGWFTLRKLLHVAVLIEHPKGDILWDSGIGSEYEDQMSVLNFFEKQLFSIENVKPAYKQLQAGAYNFEKLMAIIPSHMHWDHASGLEDFNSLNVPVWIQDNSYQEAQTGKPPGFIKSQFDSPRINWKSLKLNDKPFLGFSESLDIYGDGSAVLVDLSGHTHGQLGLFLNLPDNKQYFFIGDTAWSVIGIEQNSSRPSFVDWLVGVDTDFEKNSVVIEKIHKLAKREPNIFIAPAHDELQIQKLPLYPVFSD